MKSSLKVQLPAILILSLVLGVLFNTLRGKGDIALVRDWSPYSSLMAEDDPAPISDPIKESEEAGSREQAPERDPEQVQIETARLVENNFGITDIGLQEARDIYEHMYDATLWIDARDPELFEKGHIEGAELLYFYDQSTYIDQITAEIDARAPMALVIYCKGKDCTDSHHLAEDLNRMGLAQNIFVYKDGYDDWAKAGLPIAPRAEGDAPEGTDDGRDVEQVQIETAQLVESNFGITDIGLDQARDIFRYMGDLTLWIDARDPELYEQGHIKGARLLHFYEQDAYIDQITAEIEARQPLALVIYCKGKDCTDSHHLAEDLNRLGLAQNIFVYKDGYQDWEKAGLPVEPEAEITTVETNAATASATTEEKPPGMYLEHVLRDGIPFLLGLFFLIFWGKWRDNRGALLTAVLVVGLFFIWAAYPKIGNPLMFAKDIWNYDLAPAGLINISALWMPMLELLAALAMILGFWRRGGAAWVAILLVIFMSAVSFNVMRGHEFNCGCTSTGTMLTDIYLVGWNDKYLLLLRDFGLLVMALFVFKQSAEK